jgi:hypothetical protein
VQPRRRATGCLRPAACEDANSPSEIADAVDAEGDADDDLESCDEASREGAGRSAAGAAGEDGWEDADGGGEDLAGGL